MRLYSKTLLFVLGIAEMDLKLKLNKAQAYNLHAEFRMALRDYRMIHKENLDQDTFYRMADMIHDVIKTQTIKE